MATPPSTPPRAISSGHLSMRKGNAIRFWKKPMFFVFADSSIPLDRLELVYQNGVKKGSTTGTSKQTTTTADEVTTMPVIKSDFEAKNERLFKTMAIAAVSGSGILAVYKSNNDEDLKRPESLINLRDIVDVTLAPKLSKEGRCVFIIHTADKKIVLAAKSDEELEQWVKAIQSRVGRLDNDEIEIRGEYRFVYESLAADKAFKNDVEVGMATEEVTPETEIVVEQEAAVAEETTTSVEKDASRKADSVVAEEADIAEDAPKEPAPEELATEESKEHATNEPATEESTSKASVLEEPAPPEPAAEESVPVKSAESAPDEPASETSDAAAHVAEPAEQVPIVSSRPKSTVLASIASLFKKKPVDKVAEQPVPQDVDDNGSEEPAPDVQVDPVAYKDIAPAEETAAPLEIDTKDVNECDKPASEPAKSAEVPDAAAPPAKKRIFRILFPKRGAPAAPVKDANHDDERADLAQAEASAPEEQPAEAPVEEVGKIAKEPVEAALSEDQVENKSSEPQPVEDKLSEAQPVEVDTSEAAPVEVKPEATKSSGIGRTLSRLFKKRDPAAPVSKPAIEISADATDAAVEPTDIEVEVPAEVAVEGASEAVEVPVAGGVAAAALEVTSVPESKSEPAPPADKPNASSLVKSVSKLFKKTNPAAKRSATVVNEGESTPTATPDATPAVETDATAAVSNEAKTVENA